MWRYLILVCVLAGCNTPTAAFRGAEPRAVSVDGSTYKVYVRDGHAQAIRVNSEMNYRRGAEVKVRRAIQQASGCRVVGDLKGDPVVANARVACDGRSAPPPKRPEPSGFVVCDVYGETDPRRAYCLPG